MTDPETYIQSRRNALVWYIYRDGLTQKDIAKECGFSEYRCNSTMKGTNRNAHTVDNLYKAAKRLSGRDRRVEGPDYKEWHDTMLAYIKRFQKQKGWTDSRMYRVLGYKAPKTDKLHCSRALWNAYQAIRGYSGMSGIA